MSFNYDHVGEMYLKPNSWFEFEIVVSMLIVDDYHLSRRRAGSNDCPRSTDV